jgi:hypothetical protein
MWQQIKWTGGGADLARRNAQIASRGPQAPVSAEQLDGANVGSGFEQGTANACLMECGEIGLEMPESNRPFWQASHTPSLETGWSTTPPGNSQVLGLSLRHQSRRICSRVAESMT